MGDGGQWDMAKDIIKKYGIIPKQIMPDSYHAKKSSEMNKILTFNLKNDFNILDSTTQDNLIPTIQIMVNNIYNILVGFLGKPPNSFNWSFKSKNKVLTWTEFTPLSFLKKTGFEPDELTIAAVELLTNPEKTLKYDVILDDGENSRTAKAANFASMIEAIQYGIPIPPAEVVETSPWANKRQIVEGLEQQQMQQQMAQMTQGKQN